MTRPITIATIAALAAAAIISVTALVTVSAVSVHHNVDVSITMRAAR